MFDRKQFNNFANWLADTEDVDYAEGFSDKELMLIEKDWKTDFTDRELRDRGYRYGKY